MPQYSSTLQSQDVEQGVLLWLPPKHEVLTALGHHAPKNDEPVVSITNQGQHPEDGFYDHPLLVISRSTTSPDRIHFVPLTTFGGKLLCKRYNQYLAMTPAPDHPHFTAGDTAYRTLTLHKNATISRPGYVKITSVWTMRWKGAKHYWGGSTPRTTNFQLDESSLQRLLLCVRKLNGYTPREQFCEARQLIPKSITPNLTGHNYHQADTSFDLFGSATPSSYAAIIQQQQATRPSIRIPAAGIPSYCSTVGERRPLLPTNRQPWDTPKESSGCGCCGWLFLCLVLGLGVWLWCKYGS
ncbi:uncharacterized protein LTR77_004232 [Saxophila tyrrhenica]|uniref:Uncharacterized protein n=1 Tax=Saxophila tyrrhenica TaxID=1690608 RepID=A0AAV9PGD6_9PEZI|nr:hypothetical protein LTR77_004232 [Saxophila tyrrhenica]